MWPIQLFAKQINIFKLFLLLSAGSQGLLCVHQGGGGAPHSETSVGHTSRSFSVLAVRMRVYRPYSGKFLWYQNFRGLAM